MVRTNEKKNWSSFARQSLCAGTFKAVEFHFPLAAVIIKTTTKPPLKFELPHESKIKNADAHGRNQLLSLRSPHFFPIYCISNPDPYNRDPHIKSMHAGSTAAPPLRLLQLKLPCVGRQEVCLATISRRCKTGYPQPSRMHVRRTNDARTQRMYST